MYILLHTYSPPPEIHMAFAKHYLTVENCKHSSSQSQFNLVAFTQQRPENLKKDRCTSVLPLAACLHKASMSQINTALVFLRLLKFLFCFLKTPLTGC